MHLISECEGESAQAQASSAAPFGPGFSDDVVEKTAKLTIMGSSFADPGPEFTEFEVLDKDGKSLGKRRLAGY
jgi:hypothetical protein